MWTLLVTFAIAVICVYFFLSLNYEYWKKRGVPHPPVSILFGNLRESLTFKKSLGQIYDDIYNNYPSLSYVGFYKMRAPGIILKDPELIREVLVKDFTSFHANDVIVDQQADPMLAKNPFFMTGEKWKTTRNTLTPSFTSKQEEVCKTLNKYLEEASHDKNGIEAKDLCQKFTLDVVASCAVGLEANSFLDPNTEFRRMTQKILSTSFLASVKFLLLFTVPTLTKVLKLQVVPNDASDYFRNIIAQTMEYRKANNVKRNDFLDMMQELKGKLGEEVFSNEHITAHSLSFFIDGFETSSIILSFALYELGANPDLQDKLKSEIDETLKRNGGKFNYDAVHEMVYLNKFLNETLRVHPAGMFLAKLCTKHFTLPSPDGKGPEVTLEPGTAVVIPIYSLHHDSKYYPDPEKFDPERFSEENKDRHVKYTFIPFNEGPRMCLGRRFAIAQIKTAIVNLVSAFEIRVNRKTIRPLQIDPTYFLLAAKGGLWLDFHKRNKF